MLLHDQNIKPFLDDINSSHGASKILSPEPVYNLSQSSEGGKEGSSRPTEAQSASISQRRLDCIAKMANFKMSSEEYLAYYISLIKGPNTGSP